MITFTKQPPTDKLISSHNNSIMQFTSSLSNPLYATITNDLNSTVIKIFPSPIGMFWVNLQSLYKSFFEFKDEIAPEYYTPEIDNIFFLDENLLKEVTFTVTVHNATTSENTTTTLEILLQALQDKMPYLNKELQFISNNFTFFMGYPYSIDIYSDLDYPYVIFGTINGVFEMAGAHLHKGINRLFLDDGSNNINERIFPGEIATFLKPYPFVIYTSIDKTGPTITDAFNIYPFSCAGIYLKWLSNNGWKYWLFNELHKEVIQTKTLGQIENDFNIPEETISPIIELGKTSSSTMKLHATFVRDSDREHVYSILESPKVFLYTGQPNQKATLNDWLEVRLLTSSLIYNNYDRTKNNIEFEIETRRNTISML